MTAVWDRPVAMLGLGVMGAGLAERLLDSGTSVRVWNRSPERAAPLGARGAAVAATPVEAAAGTGATIVAVADGEALDGVLLGRHGVLADGGYPGILLCASTVSPDDVPELARRASGVLDVGMMGNREHARAGQLRLYVGGDASVLAAARPLLDLLGKQVVHVGPLGTGMRLKLLLNLLMGVELQAMAEATELGVAGGLDRQVVLDAIAHSGFAAPVMAFKASRLASARFGDPDFRLRLMAKDLALAVAQAAGAGLRLPVTEAASRTHQAAVDRGYGDDDCAAVIRMVGAAEAVGER
ncbi:NAD(P)-dependent oxidoreductase [Gandjariella thermophila]|uniref:3-hydroxyisobutyrate dehydrogenase n=1 Tax=Gandjariella thermophila TaxID=1931992 RepID=A0A4D4J4B6_9PSEU|nr:NAD(P)-dependent oxidoreductase [Gandjariella thermophila]GDY28817.1 3-hydroxyisobutyrate dehydrogenase [Gandjariella thermophila]